MNKLQVLSLKRRQNELANAKYQREILSGLSEVSTFDATVAQHGLPVLASNGIEILQVNVGKMCNMTCRHCHVDAGPDRREIMTKETIDHCLRTIDELRLKTVDLTGGAPEMNPNFRYFVTEARKLDCHVIDRCNLTILLANGYTDLPEFLAENQVEVVASLPCYLEENCDSQRGSGAFQKSVEALKRLNDVGYGNPDSGLTLSLVYNPVGTSLPPNQASLEAKYKDVLWDEYQLRFNRLFTITNMPISRYLEDLLEQKKLDLYMETLVNAFNPDIVSGVMCRNTLSVSWDGRLFDCDFNQMLEMPLTEGQPQQISELNARTLQQRRIATARHCFGCTAGAGSGCGGAIDNA